jgi:hypothetical protein
MLEALEESHDVAAFDLALTEAGDTIRELRQFH